MMNWNELPPEAAKFVPGAVGSLFSMLWIKEHYARMIVMFFGGVAFSYYASTYTVRVTGFDTGIAGFLLGLFGMSIIASLFAGWQKLDISIILRDTLRSFLRLPPAPKEENK
jgi:pilus assembly protein TadC